MGEIIDPPLEYDNNYEAGDWLDAFETSSRIGELGRSYDFAAQLKTHDLIMWPCNILL